MSILRLFLTWGIPMLVVFPPGVWVMRSWWGFGFLLPGSALLNARSCVSMWRRRLTPTARRKSGWAYNNRSELPHLWRFFRDLVLRALHEAEIAVGGALQRKRGARLGQR